MILIVTKKKNNENKEKNTIPPLEKDEALDLLELNPSQHFTKPPPRFSDSSLVKALEEDDREDASPSVVVHPGEDHGERNNADEEQPELQCPQSKTGLISSFHKEEGKMPERPNTPQNQSRRQRGASCLQSIQNVASPAQLLDERNQRCKH